ncbi:hypothetical protein ACE1B6_19530 [Aerosakkonemataceae cyanobacterium BLCC-F154]|uniref:Late competence development ComFB family protein n=1 Tax=Floridaenema fluviatile BLCC-F154 TaxID=3153640 RepID=A0ABV4YF37_9CYAN
MEKQLFNLTLPIVIEEIENILATYPISPYQKLFSVNGLRQDLVAYVLSRVPNKYAVLEATETFPHQSLFPPYSSKQLLYIEHYIHLGIRELFNLYSKNNVDKFIATSLKLNNYFLS